MFCVYILVLEVGQVQNEGPRSLKFPSQKATGDIQEYTKPNWLTDSVELDFNTWIIENIQESKWHYNVCNFTLFFK